MYPTMFRIPFLPDWLADVKSYGVMMTIAFLTGIWMACRRADRSRANPDIVLNIGFISLICGVAGARAMFVLHYWDTRFANQPSPIAAIFDIRAGGLEFWGGPLLTIPAIAIYLHFIAKASPRWYLDMAAPSLAWGLAITRIGCFLNGCCWGAVCVDPSDPAHEKAQYPWAVRFPYSSPAMVQQYKFGQLTIPKELVCSFERSGESLPMPEEFLKQALEDDSATSRRLDERHRAAMNNLKAASASGPESEAFKAARQEEEAARRARMSFANSAIGIVEGQCQKYGMTVREMATLAAHYRSKPVHPTQLYETVSALLICLILSKLYYYRRRHGIVLPWFLILYSISRVIHESIRQDNPLDVGGVTISQAISAATFLAGILLLLWIHKGLPLVSPRVAPFVWPDEEPARAEKK
ncbi:MAG: hypothetical protein DCC65_16880 [Planctomycetota bacterium]|nr:MAG: hypothetical protein DCC65_16880 [Planctomycetota bacterium]